MPDTSILEELTEGLFSFRTGFSGGIKALCSFLASAPIFPCDIIEGIFGEGKCTAVICLFTVLLLTLNLLFFTPILGLGRELDPWLLIDVIESRLFRVLFRLSMRNGLRTRENGVLRFLLKIPVGVLLFLGVCKGEIPKLFLLCTELPFFPLNFIDIGVENINLLFADFLIDVAVLSEFTGVVGSLIIFLLVFTLYICAEPFVGESDGCIDASLVEEEDALRRGDTLRINFLCPIFLKALPLEVL